MEVNFYTLKKTRTSKSYTMLVKCITPIWCVRMTADNFVLYFH